MSFLIAALTKTAIRNNRVIESSRDYIVSGASLVPVAGEVNDISLSRYDIRLRRMIYCLFESI